MLKSFLSDEGLETVEYAIIRPDRGRAHHADHHDRVEGLQQVQQPEQRPVRPHELARRNRADSRTESSLTRYRISQPSGRSRRRGCSPSCSTRHNSSPTTAVSRPWSTIITGSTLWSSSDGLSTLGSKVQNIFQSISNGL